MDSKIILMMVLVGITSGCIDSSSTIRGSSEGGVYLDEFSVAESEVDPGQITQVRAVFINEKQEEVNLKQENVELFNTGEMEVREKTCTPEEMKDAREDLSSTMECTWEVEVPGEDWIRGFPTKPLSINLVYTYETRIDPDTPLTLEFREEENAVNREEVQKQVSDGKVMVSVEGKSPLPLNSDQKIKIKAENTGPGRVEEGYSFEYTPENIIVEDDCPKNPEVINQKSEFECTVNTGLEGERKLFMTPSYKYQEIHNNIIEVKD